MFAERDYYGKPCGLLDQLAIALGRPAMIDFRNEDPEIEFVDLDLDTAGLDDMHFRYGLKPRRSR